MHARARERARVHANGTSLASDSRITEHCKAAPLPPMPAHGDTATVGKHGRGNPTCFCTANVARGRLPHYRNFKVDAKISRVQTPRPPCHIVPMHIVTISSRNDRTSQPHGRSCASRRPAQGVSSARRCLVPESFLNNKLLTTDGAPFRCPFTDTRFVDLVWDHVWDHVCGPCFEPR